LYIYGGTFAPLHFPVKKIMEGTPSPIKQHFTNTQFIGGMYYVFRESIYPFDPYCSVTEEGMLLTYKGVLNNISYLTLRIWWELL
jgi:hypothetical protein